MYSVMKMDREKPTPVFGVGSSSKHLALPVMRQLQSGRFLPESAQTSGADASLPGRVAFDNGLLVQIDLPTALGSIVRMTDTVTELSTLTADLTYSGHYLIPLCHTNYIQGYHVASA